MINMFDYFNFNQLYKFASKEGFISRLRAIGTRDEIIGYVEGLEENLCGVVVGAVVKNKDISLDQLKELVANKERVEQLKKETAKQIEEDLSVEEERIRNWIIPQVKKDKKNRALFLGNLDKINRFLSENDVDLATYDLKSLLDYIDRIENFGSASGESQDPVSQFLAREMDRLNQKLLTINNLPLATWARKKAIVIYGEWEKQIRKAMVEKPFEQLMEESNKIREDINNGLYRGRELPYYPLRNGEYESLVSNIESLDDWHRNTASDIREYSINGAIAASNQWHREMADSGEGFQYEKIDRSDIVFGPDGWRSEENNGHFILELKSENDLKVEGAKMNHCVGRDSTYAKGIKEGTLRIFSLRHINNVYQPILTVETDSSGFIVRQDYGPGDSKIDQRYHDMVTEWSSKNKMEDISKITPEDIFRIEDPNFLKEIVTKTNDTDVLFSIAQNPSANQAVFEAIMAKTNDTDVLESIAGNRAANQDILAAIMAKTNNRNVLRAVAANPSANQTIFEAIMANAYGKYTLDAIASNPAVSQDMLLAIVVGAETYDIDVLQAAAINPVANRAILAEIINKTYYAKVLESVARNRAVSQSMLAVIATKTHDPYVLASVAASRAVNQATISAIIAKTNDPYVLQSVAKNPVGNQTIFASIIAKTNDPHVLISIAQNPAANRTILAAILNETEDPDVLEWVAANPGVNQDIFAAIMHKTDGADILESFAKNPGADQAILSAIMTKTNDPNILNLVRSRIEALKQKTTIASASYIDLIYKRACRFERVSLSN